MTPDATAAALHEEIEAATAELKRVAQQHPEAWRPAYELKAEARNGWSDGAMNIALNRLIEDGTFEVRGAEVRLKS